MITAIIVLPVRDNEDLPLDVSHKTVQHYLTTGYNGFTASDVWGTDHDTFDQSIQYVVSMRLNQLEGFLRWAEGLKRKSAFNQDSIYVRIEGGAGLL